MKWFSISMSVIYILAGVMLLFTNVAGDLIVEYRSAFGAILIGYGLVRGFLWLRKNQGAS